MSTALIQQAVTVSTLVFIGRISSSPIIQTFHPIALNSSVTTSYYNGTTLFTKNFIYSNQSIDYNDNNINNEQHYSSAQYMGAATLANMMCNITGEVFIYNYNININFILIQSNIGFSLAFGFCSSLDTLISQAYGAKLYKLMGLYTQRAIVILTIASIPVGFIWLQTGYILHNFLFIDPIISSLAAKWSRILVIGLWPSLIFEILRKFLQGGQIIWPVVVSASVSILFNISCNLIMVYIWHWGYFGVALAVSLTRWVVSNNNNNN